MSVWLGFERGAVMGYLVAFVLAGMNPMGGMFLAIPIAMFKLHWPGWLSVLLAIPLAYVQVAAVDLLWDRLVAWPFWSHMVKKRRSERLTALLARSDAWLWLAVAGPWLGPWLVMAVTRFSGHRQRRIALPILLGLTYVGIGTGVICHYAPDLLPK